METDPKKLEEMNNAIMRDAKQNGQEGNLTMGEGGVMRVLSADEMGADCGKYKWGQTEDEVSIKVAVPAGTKSKAVSLKVTSNKLKLVVLGDTAWQSFGLPIGAIPSAACVSLTFGFKECRWQEGAGVRQFCETHRRGPRLDAVGWRRYVDEVLAASTH